MHIAFLGTGTSQGVPVIACKCAVCQSVDPKDKRLRSAVLIQHKGNTILIDAGPDFRYQMLRSKVERLDAILLTHGHKDHIGGLDDVRAYNYIQKRATDVYANAETLKVVENEFYYAFHHSDYPGVPEINLHKITNDTLQINGIEITTIKAKHSYLDVLGYRIENFAYITDANFIPDKEMEKLKGLDVLVINALRKSKHHSHFSLDESIDIIKTLKPKAAYLTHISHLMGKHKIVNKELEKNVSLAYDGLEIRV